MEVLPTIYTSTAPVYWQIADTEEVEARVVMDSGEVAGGEHCYEEMDSNVSLRHRMVSDLENEPAPRRLLCSWLVSTGKRLSLAAKNIRVKSPPQAQEPGCLAAFCELLSYASLFGGFGNGLPRSILAGETRSKPRLFPTKSATFGPTFRFHQSADFLRSAGMLSSQFFRNFQTFFSPTYLT